MALTRPRYSQIYDTDFKQSVRVATTTDVGDVNTSTMPSVVDGVTLLYFDRVLVKNQANAAQNGIYYVQAVGTGSNGIWKRAPDADTGALLGGNQFPPTAGSVAPGLMAYVDEGSQSGKVFKLATTGNISLGSTTLNFQAFTGEAGGNPGTLQIGRAHV